MPHVILILGMPGDPWPEEPSRWLKSYDPDGDLELTTELEEAKRYRSPKEALEDWRAVSVEHPLRADGKPNRPLSAFTITIDIAPEGR